MDIIKNLLMDLNLKKNLNLKLKKTLVASIFL